MATSHAKEYRKDRARWIISTGATTAARKKGTTGWGIMCILHTGSQAQQPRLFGRITPFRSGTIIENSNAFMEGLGKPSRSAPGKNDGKILVEYVDDVEINARKNEEGKIEKKEDGRFVFYRIREGEEKVSDNSFIQARYLKKVFEIISGKPFSKQSYAILSRTNHLYHTDLGKFRIKLKECFPKKDLDEIGDFNEFVKVGTAHSFKGLEADTVIILRSCPGSFPLIHPDSSLFSLFGQTEQDIVDEERRLFYVALTRAKNELWILTEKERESDFLRKIPVFSAKDSQQNRLPDLS